MTLIEFICARVDDDEAAGKVWDEKGFTEAATDAGAEMSGHAVCRGTPTPRPSAHASSA